MNKLKKNWVDLFFSLVIFVIVSFVAFKNYTPNTYLTGWDNLHPEFNFKLNIERSLNAVWQEYQGLGLLGGMAHGADLPRQLFLWGVSIFLPMNLIRYFWTFLMLFIGPLGVYFLVKILLDSRSSFLRVSPEAKTSHSAAAIGASIFYLCNLATVQYFFVPFETFTAFFGFLPWLIYFAYNYLAGKKSLLNYALISVLAIPAFYVQTLFVVYVMLLLCLALFNLKKSVWLFLVTFLVNSFWLLPVAYFTLTSGSVPTNSKINSIATPETYYMNMARNDFGSIVTFKGYWFDYYDWNQETQKFDYLYKNWENFSSKSEIKYLGIGLFLVSILGLLLNRQITWVFIFIASVIMISGVKIPISVLAEAFRNSFTKWSVALSFITSIGIGFFLSRFKKILLYLLSTAVIASSIYQVMPIFNGNLISQSMRVKIPDEYFLVFDFLNSRTNGGRIAVLPLNSFFGWQFHDWGYRGSGFYWYGIKNPILDRAFDVWSKSNENFYEELNFALSTNDTEVISKVFDKYQVTYILYDKNIFNPENERIKSPYLSKFKMIASFGNIEIYETGYFGDNISPQKIEYPNQISKLVTKLDFQNMNSEPNIKEAFAEGQGYKEIRNCDLFVKGTVDRKRTNDGNLYFASGGGVACDYFYYPTIDNLKPFALHINGNNLEGRSLKIYLYNPKTKKVVLEELLSEKKFDKYFLIRPSYYDTEDKSLADGYTLSVETRSFGKISSKNLISEIEIYSLNLDNQISESKIISTDLQINNIKKYGTAIYKFETTGSGVIELGQGYEKGWVTVEVGQSWSKLEHVKINGWANGFVVPISDGTIPSTYWIFFWPQFLEWGGFLLLLLTLVTIIVKSKKIS